MSCQTSENYTGGHFTLCYKPKLACFHSQWTIPAGEYDKADEGEKTKLGKFVKLCSFFSFIVLCFISGAAKNQQIMLTLSVREMGVRAKSVLDGYQIFLDLAQY